MNRLQPNLEIQGLTAVTDPGQESPFGRGQNACDSIFIHHPIQNVSLRGLVPVMLVIIKYLFLLAFLMTEIACNVPLPDKEVARVNLKRGAPIILKMRLPAFAMRESFKVEFRKKSHDQELINSGVRVEVFIKNTGAAPVNVGTIEHGEVRLIPGASIRCYSGPLWKMIEIGRHSGPFWVEGERAHADLAMVFTGVNSLKDEIDLSVESSPARHPL